SEAALVLTWSMAPLSFRRGPRPVEPPWLGLASHSRRVPGYCGSGAGLPLEVADQQALLLGPAVHEVPYLVEEAGALLAHLAADEGARRHPLWAGHVWSVGLRRRHQGCGESTPLIV